MLGLTLGNASWLLARVTGLVVHVGLGVMALRPGCPKAVRAAAWVAALATAAWIGSVAFAKGPPGLFGRLV